MVETSLKFKNLREKIIYIMSEVMLWCNVLLYNMLCM